MTLPMVRVLEMTVIWRVPVKVTALVSKLKPLLPVNAKSPPMLIPPPPLVTPASVSTEPLVLSIVPPLIEKFLPAENV